jgi:acyl dehydratase
MDRESIMFKNIQVGMELKSFEIGPWTVPHIVRWCAAQENWERQHIDFKYATEHEGLPNVIANGNWRKHIVARLFKDWAGTQGWLWKLFMRYTGMHFPGDSFLVHARVVEKQQAEDVGIIKLIGGVLNQNKQETTPSIAIVIVPLSDGKEIRYPFSSPQGLEIDAPFSKGTASKPTLYITDEVKAYIGKGNEETESWDEVCKSELRRFSQAIPDPDPVYWDNQYAAKTKYGSIVAPPLFPVDAFKTPPDYPDRLTNKMREDPNFWGGPPGDARFAENNGTKINFKTTVSSTLNGGQDFEIYKFAHIGEKIRVKTRLIDVYEKASKTFGRIVVVENESTYTNNKGELLLRMISRGIKR